MCGCFQVLNIAREHEAVIPNFGLHPWWGIIPISPFAAVSLLAT